MATIIRIKYSPVNSDEENNQSEEPEKELLVNINCPLQLILHYIRVLTGLSDTTEFDLCDEINCQLRKVSFFEPRVSGLDVFQTDLTYFVVTYERDANGQMMNFVPLLTGKEAKRCSDTILKAQVPQKKSLLIRSPSKKKLSDTKISQNPKLN